ncbi:hypothetical protein THIOKS13320029 [Thiocapsa sp. KS1]|nr:hypothetical protein THIOKS13320029 [Thiocapsa sp. KS1]
MFTLCGHSAGVGIPVNQLPVKRTKPEIRSGYRYKPYVLTLFAQHNLNDYRVK